eukprot:2602648-Rhodomonas_salina.1
MSALQTLFIADGEGLAWNLVLTTQHISTVPTNPVTTASIILPTDWAFAVRVLTSLWKTGQQIQCRGRLRLNWRNLNLIQIDMTKRPGEALLGVPRPSVRPPLARNPRLLLDRPANWRRARRALAVLTKRCKVPLSLRLEKPVRASKSKRNSSRKIFGGITGKRR